MNSSEKAKEYAAAERRYRNNRQELSDRLSELRVPGEIPDWMKRKE